MINIGDLVKIRTHETGKTDWEPHAWLEVVSSS
jgi:hypothetical protein